MSINIIVKDNGKYEFPFSSEKTIQDIRVFAAAKMSCAHTALVVLKRGEANKLPVDKTFEELGILPNNILNVKPKWKQDMVTRAAKYVSSGNSKTGKSKYNISQVIKKNHNETIRHLEANHEQLENMHTKMDSCLAHKKGKLTADEIALVPMLCDGDLQEKRNEELGIVREAQSRSNVYKIEQQARKQKRKEEHEQNMILKRSKKSSNVSAVVPEPKPNFTCDTCGKNYKTKKGLPCMQGSKITSISKGSTG